MLKIYFNLIFRTMKIISILLSMIVIGINVFFVYRTVSELNLSFGPIIAIIIVAIFYMILVIYLAIHMIVSLQSNNFMHIDFIKKFVLNDDERTLDVSI